MTPTMSSVNNVVNMLNSRVAASAVQRKMAEQAAVLVGLEMLEQQVEEENVDKVEIGQEPYYVLPGEEAQVRGQVNPATRLLSNLHRAVEYAELQMYYEEKLANATDPDEIEAYQKAADYYAKCTSEAFLTEIFQVARGWAVRGHDTLLDAEGYEAYKALAGNLIDWLDMSALGLKNLDSMSATDKRDALLGAIDKLTGALGSVNAKYQGELKEYMGLFDLHVRDLGEVDALHQKYYNPPEKPEEKVETIRLTGWISIADVKLGNYGNVEKLDQEIETEITCVVAPDLPFEPNPNLGLWDWRQLYIIL